MDSGDQGTASSQSGPSRSYGYPAVSEKRALSLPSRNMRITPVSQATGSASILDVIDHNADSTQHCLVLDWMEVSDVAGIIRGPITHDSIAELRTFDQLLRWIEAQLHLREHGLVVDLGMEKETRERQAPRIAGKSDWELVASRYTRLENDVRYTKIEITSYHSLQLRRQSTSV